MRNTIKLNLQWKNNTIEGVTDGQLEADIKALHEAFCKAVTERAATNIEKFARIEMEDYYTEIHEKPSHPIYYKRTKDMLNNSYEPFQEEDGDIYSGGIDIDSGFTTHEHGFNGNPPGCVTSAGFDEEEIILARNNKLIRKKCKDVNDNSKIVLTNVGMGSNYP